MRLKASWIKWVVGCYPKFRATVHKESTHVEKHLEGTTLVLSNCRNLDKLFPLGAIQKLCEIRYLKVEKCNEIEEIIPEADAVANLPVLPKLEALILLDMTKLRSICAIQSLEWPSLEKLEIIKCPGLCRLPFNKGNSANLEHIEAEQEWWGALQWQNQEDKEGLQKLCIFT